MRMRNIAAARKKMSAEEESSSSESESESEGEREREGETVETTGDNKWRNLPEGAPRIASGALMEGGADEEWRFVDHLSHGSCVRCGS